MKTRFFTGAFLAVALFVVILVGVQLTPQPAKAAPSKALFPTVASTGVMRAGTDFRLTAQTSITVTNASTLSPTGTYQPVTASGTVTLTSITIDTQGTVLLVYNTSSGSVIVPDSGILKLGGARTLGQNDVLYLFSDGTNWVEIALGNN